MRAARKPKPEPKAKLFATEADLCAAFVSALPKGWTPYAETAGWDILLVRDEDGFQIGVQAKLKLNVDVIDQALEDSGRWYGDRPGPDCRAVLVPGDAPGRLGKISAFVGLTVIRVYFPQYYHRPEFHPDLPKRSDWHEDWHEMAPAKRYDLPEYVPDVRAGSASPLQLTEWKIKAIKIAVLLEERGYVTRRDFAALQLDHRRWIAMEWLKVQDGRYVAGAMPDFQRQHPVNFVQINGILQQTHLGHRGGRLTPSICKGKLKQHNQGGFHAMEAWICGLSVSGCIGRFGISELSRLGV
jgi:hypothetical protein